jgi:hypothetical protein
MISLPKTQALNSKTFRVPQALADDSLALPELYDWHSENSPNHPLFVFEDEPKSIRTIFWPEAVRAIHRAAYRVSSAIEDDTSLTRIPVVAILAATGMLFLYVYGLNQRPSERRVARQTPSPIFVSWRESFAQALQRSPSLHATVRRP